MSLYGINNVRGGSYVTIDLSDEEISFIMREIWTSKNACIRCGRSSHFVKDCNAKSDINGKNLTSIEDQIICFKCGRLGHISPNCYAKSDVNGKKL